MPRYHCSQRLICVASLCVSSHLIGDAAAAALGFTFGFNHWRDSTDVQRAFHATFSHIRQARTLTRLEH